jgi:hypothetical protein
MPYRKTSLRRRVVDADLTSDKIEYLFHGYILTKGNSSPFESDDAARKFWIKHRALIVRWYSLAGVPAEYRRWSFEFENTCGPFPGCRPWAWWKFDAPEKRRRIIAMEEFKWHGDKPAEFSERPVTEAEVEEIWQDYGGDEGFGIPQFSGLFIVESEADYLKRHGLLTVREQVRLRHEEKKTA